MLYCTQREKSQYYRILPCTPRHGMFRKQDNQRRSTSKQSTTKNTTYSNHSENQVATYNMLQLVVCTEKWNTYRKYTVKRRNAQNSPIALG